MKTFAAAISALAIFLSPSIGVADDNTSELLRKAIGQFGQFAKRDIVVVDKNEVILADAVTDEIGSRFDHDRNSEVSKSLKDGKVRSFKEVSKAYPGGITLQVVPISGKNGDILGALIFQP